MHPFNIIRIIIRLLFADRTALIAENLALRHENPLETVSLLRRRNLPVNPPLKTLLVCYRRARTDWA
jgi:hypothetical protein